MALICFHEMQNAFELLVFFFLLFFFWRYLGFGNCKSVFLILKVLQYGGSRQRVQLFPSYSCKTLYKNWNLCFYRTCGHQIWQAGTSAEFDSSESNQAVDSDVVTSRSPKKLKTLNLFYQNAYDHQNWPYGNLAWWAPPHNVTYSFDYVVL